MKFKQGGLSRKETRRLEQAKKLAAISDCSHLHGAVAERGGSVIGVGVNSYRNSLSVFEVIPPESRSVHAEEACLMSIGSHAEGATFYVARVNKRGEEMMSRPCARCTILLQEAGVKRVVYTVESSMEFD